MNTSEMILQWEFKQDDPSVVLYYINNVFQGENDEGFNEVLLKLQSNKEAEIIIEMKKMYSLGSEKFEGSFPFRARIKELNVVVGNRKIGFSVF